MRVLAIDPGYGRCGVALLQGSGTTSELLHSSCIETSPKDAFADRLFKVADEILRLITLYDPEIIAIEELYFTNNAKTALKVAEVRGVLIYIAVSNKIPLVEYNPLAIKIAITGYGRASKEQVIKMVEKLVKFPKKIMLDDEYDAIALGLTALAGAKYNEIRRPK